MTKSLASRPLPLASLAFSAILAVFPMPAGAQDQTPLQRRYQPTIDRIMALALSDSSAYARVGELVDRFGHRLSGSESLERAIAWVHDRMLEDKLDNVRVEPVMVPHWVRGKESAALVEPRPLPLPMLGLGGSVATPAGGITAEVLVVRSFDELHMAGDRARGKIVLFDYPFPTSVPPFTGYGRAVAYRVRGAIEAAKAGGVACLIRSVASYSIRSPHTGVMRYDSVVPPVPAAALTVEDAEMLRRMQDRGEKIVVHLEMEAQTLPDAQSGNVMGEVKGWQQPNQVVVLGGHIDSWDVGQGAMDDAGGMVVAWEAVRLLKRLGLQPRRTVRAVGWTNEENGLRGAVAYRDAHKAEDHVLAIESDAGAFRPFGVGFEGTADGLATATEIGAMLKAIGADRVLAGAGEADISPLKEIGVPTMGLDTDERRYFWYHHSQGDTLDKLDPAELARCVATLAAMAYVVADMETRLPKVEPAR